MQDCKYDDQVDKIPVEKTCDIYPIAMAYVPWQKFDSMYENLEKAYCAGTIFPDLDKPFVGRRCK